MEEERAAGTRKAQAAEEEEEEEEREREREREIGDEQSVFLYPLSRFGRIRSHHVIPTWCSAEKKKGVGERGRYSADTRQILHLWTAYQHQPDQEAIRLISEYEEKKKKTWLSRKGCYSACPLPYSFCEGREEKLLPEPADASATSVLTTTN